jgi:HIV Tat-specific factor 1
VFITKTLQLRLCSLIRVSPLQTPAAPILARQNKKRKEPENYTSGPVEAGPSSKRGKSDKKNQQSGERKSKNTAVYVTGLPPDAELEEVVERFSKCGVLEEDDDGDPKVKLYAKDDGSFSGEALVVYFKEESVALAVAMLDGAELRLGDSSTVMDVSQADFKHKGANGDGSGGTGNANGEGGSKPRKTMDKKRATKRIVKMQQYANPFAVHLSSKLTSHNHSLES